MRAYTKAFVLVLCTLALSIGGCDCGSGDGPGLDGGRSDGGRDAALPGTDGGPHIDGPGAFDSGTMTDGGVTPTDASECVVGVVCSTGDDCMVGAIDCASGAPVCVATGDAPAGTECATGVCDGDGACVACVGGSACPTTNPCRVGTLACDSGAPVCTESGDAPADTVCPGGTCDGAGTCVAVVRTFTCGWALPSYGCNNGRASVNVVADDMAAAIIACRGMMPTMYPDFCYVRNALVGGVPEGTDMAQCAAAAPPPGTWRPTSSCCNFMGSLSCP